MSDNPAPTLSTSRGGGGLRLNIGPRLTLCFGLIILLMFGGYAVGLWQFQTVRFQAERLSGFDQELAAVLRVHSGLLSFHVRLEAIASNKDRASLIAESGPLNTSLLADTQRIKDAVSRLPSDIQPDLTILPTVQVIQRTLESQLQEITALANMSDWDAVHLRLANQVQPLEFVSLALVEKVDRQVSEEQAQAALNINRIQRRVYMVVPITVLLTLLIAGVLGLAITRSITGPLTELVESSRMLARGEFNHKVAIHGEDELAHLGQVFNDTSQQLRDLYASLQSSEDRLRRVIDTIPAHVWSTRPDGSVDFINQRLLESTGLSADELLGLGWRSIVHPDDRDKYIDEWHLALATGKQTESEARVWTAQRDYRWMLIRNVPLRDGTGNVITWYGTGIDIEDRKLAEEKLRRSEAYLAEAQHLTRTGSFAWHVSTGEIVWSDETYQIYGYDNATKPSLESFIDRTHPDDKDLLRQVLEQISSEGISFDVEHRLVMPDGAVKYLHAVAHSMADSSGLEFIGAVTDITTAKQAEESLRRAHADLAHFNRVTTMGELSASLAHEINQPIAGAVINASTCLRWLKRDQPGINQAKEAASRMVRDVNRAAEIISRIRLFFRKGTLLTEPVDINEMVQELIVLLRNEAIRDSIAVRAELTAGLPPVLGDRVQLQQVLMNLMINGIDAMKNADGPRQLTIYSGRDKNEQFLISVADTGVGLPAQRADQIFDAFFTTKGHGTGMGLRISRTIIEAHGGRLWATDNQPCGASFHFTLPTNGRVRNNDGMNSNEELR
jgi:PAS domain S-box-containing protein